MYSWYVALVCGLGEIFFSRLGIWVGVTIANTSKIFSVNFIVSLAESGVNLDIETYLSENFSQTFIYYYLYIYIPIYIYYLRFADMKKARRPISKIADTFN